MISCVIVWQHALANPSSHNSSLAIPRAQRTKEAQWERERKREQEH